jgi:hypothetical protein
MHAYLYIILQDMHLLKSQKLAVPISVKKTILDDPRS